MKNLIYIFILINFINCKTSKINLINLTGTYALGNYNKKSNKEAYEYFGKIKITQIDINKIVVDFMINKGYPSYNSCSFVGTLFFNENKTIYKTEIDTSCKITFEFLKQGIKVFEETDDYNFSCGFGNGIIVDGFFKKV